MGTPIRAARGRPRTGAGDPPGAECAAFELELDESGQARRTAWREHEPRIRAGEILLVEEVAHLELKLQPIRHAVASSEVHDRITGSLDLRGSGPFVPGMKPGVELGESSSDALSRVEDYGRRGDVVDRYAVVQSDASFELSGEADGESGAERSFALELDAAQPSPAAVPEEEEVGIRLVALDQVGDPVLVTVEREVVADPAVAQRQVVLDVGFRFEVGIPGNETPSGGARKYRSERTGSRKPRDTWPLAENPPSDPAVRAT